jgi:N-acetylneuraminic acid mutarotase
MEYARNCFGIAVVGGEIYVSGGFSEDRIQSVEKYTPSSDTWSAVAPLPEARWCHEAVAVGGTMYVVGGEMQYEGTTSSTLKYDSMQGTWSEVAPMPEPRSNAAACVVRSDIYVFGGNVEDGQALNSVFKYDTVYNSWRTLAPMPQASSENSANVLDDLVYIVGAGVEGCDVLRFDPDTGVWSELSPTLSRRDQGPSFVLNGRHLRHNRFHFGYYCEYFDRFHCGLALFFGMRRQLVCGGRCR